MGSSTGRLMTGASCPCLAPSTQLHFLPTGVVRACCRNLVAHGDVRTDRLIDIWTGSRRRDLAERVGRGDLSHGCEGCANEIRLEGWERSYASQFHYWAERMGPAGDSEWPVRMEFELSNLCNLQCIQCSGEYSSSIRIHREKRPPLPPVYGDRFFDELREFVPHVRHMNFAGGEPFMATENFRVWDLVAELNPGLTCTVCTNATHWNRQVARALDAVRFEVIVSLDGFTADTYESVRLGAHFETVMENLQRFRRHTEEAGTQLTINFCLMPQNYREFGDLLAFADDEGIVVNPQVVRGPTQCSIERLPADQLRTVADHLASTSASILPRLTLNRDAWLAEVDRITAWADNGEAVPGTRVELRESILMFRRSGAGPTDTVAVDLEQQAFADDGRTFSFDVGVDERIASCPPELAHRLGASAEDLVGQPMTALLPFVSRLDQVREDGDRADFVARVGDREARLVMLANRNDAGRADDVTVVVAFRQAD